MITHPSHDGGDGVPVADLGRVAVYLASGELDLVTGPALAAGVAQLLQTGPGQVVVDLSEVSFMDSSGLASLLHARNLANASGVSFTVRDPQRPVRQIFEITKMDAVFGVVD